MIFDFFRKKNAAKDESKTRIFAVEVSTDEGTKVYLTVLPLDVISSHGLIAEAIVGELSEGGHEDIRPENFMRNTLFVHFMQRFIGRVAPQLSGLQEEAKRLGSGHVCVIDQRALREDGSVPPENIFGMFKVVDGLVVSDSYLPSPKHQVLTNDGFFLLDEQLHQLLVQELVEKISGRSR
jgi:hypothetical protein